MMYYGATFDSRHTALYTSYSKKINLMKGEALRKGLHWKIAATVLFKLFISGNGRCHTNDAPKRMGRTLFFKCKQHTIHDP